MDTAKICKKNLKNGMERLLISAEHTLIVIFRNSILPLEFDITSWYYVDQHPICNEYPYHSMPCFLFRRLTILSKDL